MTILTGFIATPTEKKFKETLDDYKAKGYEWESGNEILFDDVDKWAAYYGKNTIIFVNGEFKTITITNEEE